MPPRERRRGRRHRRALRAALLLVIALAGTWGARAGAQRWRRGVQVEPNVPYDGRFTFVRLRYTEQWRSGWEFDYPAMERNFMKITHELTTLRPHFEGSNIHMLDDPELMKYPIAYLSEPGGWNMTDKEVAGLRAYLAKGGFLWVDDFMRNEWVNFEQQMRRVLPNARFERLDTSHPIFDSFFRIDSLTLTHPQDRGLRGEFLAIYEDNDPSKRIMVMIDYNTDVGDFMEWSGHGWFPVNVSNDAYKIAVNYVVYGMSH